VSGSVGSKVSFPRITLNTLAHTEGIWIEIPMPDFVSVDSISLANGICSGTTLLRCNLGIRDAGSTDTIDITLKLDGAGTFSSNLAVVAINDTNAANDTASVAIRSDAVVAPPANPPPGNGSSGGGGGGGRIEWLALSFLALVAARRVRALRTLRRPSIH